MGSIVKLYLRHRYRHLPGRCFQPLSAPAYRRWSKRRAGSIEHHLSHGPARMNPITSFLVLAFLVAALGCGYYVNPYLGAVFFVVAVVVGTSLKMANVWQKFVILRMGKLQSVKGAGLFAIIPLLDAVVAVIDERIQTTGFNAHQGHRTGERRCDHILARTRCRESGAGDYPLSRSA